MLSPEAFVPNEAAAHMYKAATELAQLSPDHLISFLASYLSDRARASQDIENITDNAIDDMAFSVSDQVISISPNLQLQL